MNPLAENFPFLRSITYTPGPRIMHAHLTDVTGTTFDLDRDAPAPIRAAFDRAMLTTNAWRRIRTILERDAAPASESVTLELNPGPPTLDPGNFASLTGWLHGTIPTASAVTFEYTPEPKHLRFDSVRPGFRLDALAVQIGNQEWRTTVSDSKDDVRAFGRAVGVPGLRPRIRERLAAGPSELARMRIPDLGAHADQWGHDAPKLAHLRLPRTP